MAAFTSDLSIDKFSLSKTSVQTYLLSILKVNDETTLLPVIGLPN